MTVGEWLDSRTPRPPRAIEERMSQVLGADSLRLDAREAAEACLRASEGLAAALLRGDLTSRATALDLLTADALMTYAFEAASGWPAELVPRAEAAMRRIAALGAA